MNKRGIALGLGLFVLVGCDNGGGGNGIDGMEISASQCQDSADNAELVVPCLGLCPPI